MRASTEFTKIIPNPNFITNHVISYAFINRDLVYELSFGDSIFDEEIYGLTIVSISKQKIVSGKPFATLKEARAYVARIKHRCAARRHIHEDAPGDAVQSAAGHDTTGASE